ncbi:MAG: hypothetical protein WD749_04725 [Phycisphaerales bacterium]
MTTPDHNTLNLPAGLDEADVLALVEGSPLAKEKQAAAARTLAVDARFAGMVRSMRRDREGLRLLADERAPAGLVEAATAALQPVLERQMLLGLSEGEPVSDRPPVSLVMPKRAPNIFARRLAMAAGIVLLVGGGVYTATIMMSGGGTPPGPRPVGPIASSGDAAGARARTGEPEGTSLAARGAGATVRERSESAEGTSIAAKAVPSVEPGGPAEAPSAAVAAAETAEMYGPPVPGPMSAAEALRLASEGRLIVRVVTPDTRVERVRMRLSSPPGRAGWMLHGEAPAALAAVVSPPELKMERPLRSPGAPVLTGIHAPEGAADLVGPPPPPPPEFAPAKRVFVVATRMDEGTLEGLRGAMQDAGGEVVFEEAPAPLPMAPGPVMTPASVLWWGQGPSAWNGWGAVPLVIEK